MQAEDIADLEKRVDEDPRDLGATPTWWMPIWRPTASRTRSTIDQMIALDPESPTTYETQARSSRRWISLTRRPTPGSVVELAPGDAEAWEHLGTWREEQGRLDEAIAAYPSGRA